eukprot:TRINITY_DN16083_c0_g3_i1.p1 TRINITY_DN16083_c0_g3~~TRINITY_DN16083_c0_g3_i1.p1  ORF type:complete len:736 (-),score=176.97 TRINITY_DN16083_c0_g3_i1:83-2212(-)
MPSDVVLPKLVPSASAGALQAGDGGASAGAGGAVVAEASRGVARSASSPALKKPDPNAVTLRFKGDHGLEWEGTRVTYSTMQGWMVGVRPGWVVTSVANHPVQNYDDIEEQLQAAVASDKRYEVCFRKGQANFGTEAKERADKEKRSLIKLRKTFPFQGRIERTEHRGITSRQLDRIVTFVQETCNMWTDKLPAKLSKTSGQQLRMSILNFHHLHSWVVLPATKSKKCAFVELCTSQPQLPAWFVSHWWGETLVAFVEAMLAHLAVRRLGPDVPYWVGAFSLRQHTPGGELSVDLKKSGLYKAVEAARFRVLLVLDGQGAALGRLWCAYEVSLCLDRAHAPLDFAVGGADQIHVLTQGLTEDEEQLEQDYPGRGIAAKARREEGFPLEVPFAGLNLDIQSLETTLEEDRARILNCIAGRELQGEAVQHHPSYAQLSARLRALFAATLYQPVNREGVEEDESEPRATLISKMLRADVGRKYLDMRLDGIDSPGLQLLAESLPPSLQDLKLQFRCSSIDDEDLEVLGKGLPKSLKSMCLDFSNCRGVGDRGLAALSKALDSKETELNFYLTGTSVSQEVQDWYAAEILKRAADGQDGYSKDIARALGVNLCRDPEKIPRSRKTVVPASTYLGNILSKDEAGQPPTSRAVAAFRALSGLGDAVMQGLNDAAQQRAKEIEAERAARKAEKAEKEAAKAAKAAAKEAAAPPAEG